MKRNVICFRGVPPGWRFEQGGEQQRGEEEEEEECVRVRVSVRGRADS